MLVLAVLVVLVGTMYALPSSQTPTTSSLEAAEPLPVDLPGRENDRRLQAFMQAYDALVDSVVYVGDDAVIAIGAQLIHFQDGRMLGEDRLGDPERFDPIFYPYSLTPLLEPPPATGNPVYSTDLLEALFGRTETEIRGQGKSVSFLDHKVFMNSYSLEALGAVEREIRSAAASDPVLKTWIDEIDIAYSFIDRRISGSGSRSHHAWGLAVDLVPTSYGRKHVYWRWSRVFNRDAWHQIPMSRRWAPPEAVIAAFERNGFIWGGKWSHFDTIHFEYRPELLIYNQMIEAGRSALRTK